MRYRSLSPARALRWTAALAAGALLVAGCAIDRSGAASGKPTIRLAYQTFPSGDLIVKHNRWLENALPGYNIRWTKFDSGADVNTAFLARQIDIGAIGSSPVARGLSAPLHIPYQVAFVLDVAGDNEALVARNGSGVQTIADLRGKRIGTAFASTAHYSLLAALRQNGLSAGDVKLVDLQPQTSLAAWERGDIDAVYTWLPTLDQLRKTGKDLITSRRLATAGKPTLDLGVVATEFARTHPDVIEAWRTAEVRALRTIHDHPDEASRAVAAEIGIGTDDAARQLRQGVFLTRDQLVSPAWLGTDGAAGDVAVSLHSAAEFLADQKQIDAAPPEQTFRDAVYVKGLPNGLDG
ncbi:ABC transporter substrate-binding protein [Nocardia terpenica]|uniref:taurine ABC transporter substrate-binding protein n=1 Tax=Nocardia terpenica TaxID=455432 RepID=UPI0018930264|nr:ABC transporter substrate-binding protein [Nocardia terpenica]MBF6059489.1 ABC transporter substrate-binding protein [Nocardia terpenica]MBF6102972.1 ABC transporter substrate-binding protein [Nocardia terpenica]MBF6110839.1 ABC transporter substrate-binding protein [Nocardia terpenica]MBF6116970.1 ABC transporter substrate-binding protein [Nocardia terpenica]MBF6151192.1 ABC transporter substrate-binding protein [Nocardia terpenica]